MKNFIFISHKNYALWCPFLWSVSWLKFSQDRINGHHWMKSNIYYKIYLFRKQDKGSKLYRSLTDKNQCF